MVYLWIALAVVVVAVVLLAALVIPRRRVGPHRRAPGLPQAGAAEVATGPPADTVLADRARGSGDRHTGTYGRPAAAAADQAGALAVRSRSRPAVGALARAARRPGLGRDRGDAAHRRRGRRGHGRHRRAVAHPDEGARHALARRAARTARRGTRGRAAAGTRPHPAHDTGDERPAVVLVVGVNGTGKTTTCGKLARVLVADGRTVLLGGRGHLSRRRGRPVADVGGPRRR